MARKKKNLGRPYTITTQELSAGTWIIGFVIFFIIAINDPYFPLLYLIMYIISSIITAVAWVVPCWGITKYDLNFEIDRMTNPNYQCVVRITKNKRLFRRLQETGPLGQTKGMIAGYNSDTINTGGYTMTLPNGNHVILSPDIMSTNANLEEEIGWKLVKRKYGFWGFNAYRKAIVENQIEGIEPLILKQPGLTEKLLKNIQERKKP
jgi:hypothetical protein